MVSVKPKKFLTALFYSVQTPFAVWAGIKLSDNTPIGQAEGWILITIMMLLEGIAVYYWMDAQTDQTIEGMKKAKRKSK